MNPIVPVDVRTSGNGRRAHRLADYGLPAVLSQTFRTAIHSRMGTGFRSYAHTHPDTDVILVEPALTDHRMFFSNIFSASNRREVCEHAYAATLAHLAENREAIGAKLEKHGMALRQEVLDDEGRVLFAEDVSERRTPRAAAGEIRDVLDRLDAVLDRIERSAA